MANPVPPCWFVMRDLKRCNAKIPTYCLLSDKDFEVFTPMKWHLSVRNGKRHREQVPAIRDLLFVHATRVDLDRFVKNIPTLQYRYLRGGYCEPMTVGEEEMRRFIHAVQSSEHPIYYLPEELTPAMYSRRIRIVGGPLDGYEGTLVTVRGSRVKRLLVELPMLMSVAVEVSPEYIQMVTDKS